MTRSDELLRQIEKLEQEFLNNGLPTAAANAVKNNLGLPLSEPLDPARVRSLLADEPRALWRIPNLGRKGIRAIQIWLKDFPREMVAGDL